MASPFSSELVPDKAAAASAEVLDVMDGNTAPDVALAKPSPVPLPASLALIGSSLLVLALVGATL